MTRAITLRKLKDERSHIAVGDKRSPAAYEVLLDGEVIGKVTKHSSPLWLKTSSGVRYHFRGYSLNWRYQVEGEDRDYFGGYSRERAISALVESEINK